VNSDDTDSTDVDPESDGQLLRERLAQVFAGGDPRLRRLSAAETSVTFQIADAPQSSATVLLDRQPPGLAGGDEPAEITIELTARQGVLFATGLLPVPSALLAGELPYRGPVRKYLAVHPVLRGLLAEVDADHVGR
jgi:hypothetical protein